MTLIGCAESDYRQALEAEDPFACLREAVAADVAAGVEREEIYQALRQLRFQLQGAGRDDADDVVVDVMDALTGFSSSLVAI